MSRPLKSALLVIIIFVLAMTGIFGARSLSSAPTPVQPAGKFQHGIKDQIAAALENVDAEEPEDEDPEEPELENLAQVAREVRANELGLVPVLVYHQIGEQEGRWTRTPENFRRDLRELYERGYVLVPLNDYLDGNMEVPAGKSPAIITFDDSTPGQFRLLETEGEATLDPGSAVGILMEFTERHPDFGRAATFFINAEPFGQPRYWRQKLQMLVDWGFEIGNHTYSHKYLKGLTPQEVAEEIVNLQEHIEQAVPGYQPRAFAIVQDGVPEPLASAASGSSQGIAYEHDGILWWAWSAAPSPFHQDYKAQHIQRVQVFTDSGGNSLLNWLDRISPGRYVSDGYRDTIAIPEEWQEVLGAARGKELIIYSEEESRNAPGRKQQAAEARGVHVSFMYASSRQRWEALLGLADQADLNAVQLDVKDESGRIGYTSQVAVAREIGASLGILSIEEMLAELKDRGIYSVARIVVFRDPVLAREKPQFMVRAKNGGPWSGGEWVDPYAKEVWDYNVELAREAYELGFDEVQFDYIRFPEGQAAGHAVYGSRGNDERHRMEVIADGLREARYQLGWDRTLSAALFGFLGYASDDLGIGQRPERMAPFLDYMSPMVYPSHYSQGNYGFANPNAHPYEVVRESLEDFAALIEFSGSRLRPWLQAFTLGSPSYSRPQIQAQIKAAGDAGINTWLLWDPRVSYKVEDLKTY